MAQNEWTNIRVVYITGRQNPETGNYELPTLVELAEMFNLNYPSLLNKARNEDWKSQRQDYWDEIADSIKKVRAKKIIEQAIKFDESCGYVAEQGVDHLVQFLKKLDDEEKLMDADLLERFSRILVQFQKAGRLVFGEPTNHYQHEGIKFVQVVAGSQTVEEEEVIEEEASPVD